MWPSNAHVGLDEWIEDVAIPLEVARQQLAPNSQLIMNELIPFMNDFCNLTSAEGTCDFNSNASAGVGVNRTTLGWNAAAAAFAYGYARLSLMGFTIVGADQLIGGTWPDNNPAVASLDWITGQPNAKYWVIKMLAALGSGPKLLFNTTVETLPNNASAGEVRPGSCGNVSLVADCETWPTGTWNTTEENIASLTECAARCRQCGFGLCNYVSLALEREQCSWFSHCDMDRLLVDRASATEAVTPQRDSRSAPLHALGLSYADANSSLVPQGGLQRTILLVSKSGSGLKAHIPGAAGATVSVLEGIGVEPGFEPPRVRYVGVDCVLDLGP